MKNETKYVDHVTSFSGRIQSPHTASTKYEANDQGIMKVTDTFDKDGLLMYSTGELIMSKEVFVSAYKAYIEGEKL